MSTVETTLEGIADLLVATNAFTQVRYGTTVGPDPNPPLACWAWVHPIKWGWEKPRHDEVWPDADGDGDQAGFFARTVHFAVDIHTRANGAAGINAPPGDLAEVVMKALHGQILTDVYPIVCDSGTYKGYGASSTPSHRMTVLGKFTYIPNV